MQDCPKCIAGTLLWSDVYMAWECDLCEHLVEYGVDPATGSDRHVEEPLPGEQEVKPS